MGTLQPIPAPPAAAPLASPVAPDTAPSQSSSLLTHRSLGSSTIICRGDPPSMGISSQAPASPSIPGVLAHCLPQCQVLQAMSLSGPTWPDSDVLDEPPYPGGVVHIKLMAVLPHPMGGNFIQGGFLTIFMGSLVTRVTVPVFLLLVQRRTTGDHTTSWVVFCWQILLSFTVLIRVLLAHLMGDLHMCLHLWRLCLLLRLPAVSFEA
jgi:hypothetical protein